MFDGRCGNALLQPAPSERAVVLADDETAIERMDTLEHPEKGMREWLEMFCSRWFERVSVRERPRLVTEIEELLRPKLFYDGAWHADYRRLRAIASAASLPLRTQSGMPIP